MVYLLTTIRLPPGGSITVHIYTQTVATRWQQYSTHLHTNSTQNNTKQTILRTTQKYGRMLAVPCLCELHPDVCLTTEEKARKETSCRPKAKKLLHCKLAALSKVLCHCLARATN
jgi:hypothetical protein